MVGKAQYSHATWILPKRSTQSRFGYRYGYAYGYTDNVMRMSVYAYGYATSNLQNLKSTYCKAV